MANLQFSIKSHLKPEKLMSFITDFEYYQKFFPRQLKEIKIIDRRNNVIITQESINFTSLLKSSFVQKSLHKLTSDKELLTEIIDGPAKGSVINVKCIENGQGSEVKFDADLKLSLKAKFLGPFIKKLYKRYLTAVIYKINARDLE
jgi:ribosome-associated toxin RatA of RatAB toxin-antitoxin module|tara:strand:- start:11 stop:448 length:438 start_codon:yes stop_codon:yes gene_type:complete